MKLRGKKGSDINRSAGLHLWIGMSITLSLIISAFKWTVPEVTPVIEPDEVIICVFPPIPPTNIPPPESPRVQPVFRELDKQMKSEEPIDIAIDWNEDFIHDIAFNPDEEPADEKIPDIVLMPEEAAEPYGGYEAFYRFIQENLRYPLKARRLGVEGKVFIQFIVNSDGSLSDVRAIRGIGAGCDEEAVRVVGSHPNWSPPKQRCRPVRQRIVVPITFRLN